ncbi:MAG: hypothetical protein II828_07910 [Clostridia bacterium]|nr:hypothetical protein [Clostridia bacterium]
MKKIRRAVSVLIASAMLIGAFAGCEKEVTAENLMEGITAENASEADLNDQFCQKYGTFAFKLLQKAYTSDDENVIVSPLAVAHNLGLLYNGAGGANADELKSMLGTTLTPEQMNVYIHSYEERLADSDMTKLYFNNAAWFNADKKVSVNQEFLQTNATYYGNAMFKETFGASAVTNISNWISNETRQSVEYIVDELPDDAPMYLMSSVLLDGSWSKQYSYQNIQESVFTTTSGEEQKAQMMSGYEQAYIHDDLSSGFIKEFSGGNYAFVAILPREFTNIKDYIASITVGDKYTKLFKSEMPYWVDATIPKFSYESRSGMADTLREMKLNQSFNPEAANLLKLGTSDGKLYAGDLFVRSSFSITEQGTRKGTAASVADEKGIPTDLFVITLDRPFLFMVVDRNYNLPVLLGVINRLD